MEEKGKPIEIGIAIRTYSFENCSPDTIKDFIRSNIKVGDLIGVFTQSCYKRGVVNSIDEKHIIIYNETFCAYYGDIIGIEIYNRKGMKEKECTCPIFRALKKKGLRWNSETGVIEVNRLWRARLGEIYFFINSNGELYPEKELNNKIDNMRWKIGNYFSTENEAQKYADEFKRMLKGRTLDKEE